jgi:RNA-directed DNA polymerase
MESKTQPISKRMVWEAYKQVRKNGGSAGVDNISIEKFEENLKGNLYKIWNRMCSGSYYPAAIKCVNIPKKDGSHRTLGIPTVGDRIAQTVVKEYIEEQLDKEFSESSYGYRKNKSAHDAIQAASNNCYKYAWVIDLDIRKFFDNLDHTLMIELLKQYTEEKWILMYIERWLKAPIEEEGEKRARAQGTPQGGVISPLLANLYLHEAFDKWLKEIYKSNPFERYADDIIIHCKSYQEAEQLLGQIEERLKQFKLSLHPEKTRIVYCKDVNRREDYPAITFTFLGYDYKPRKTMNKAGTILTFFTPGISQQAKKNAIPNSEVG